MNKQELAKALIYTCHIDPYSDAYINNRQDRFAAMVEHARALLKKGVKSYDIYQNREGLYEIALKQMWSLPLEQKADLWVAETWQICKLMKAIKTGTIANMSYKDL